jgi:hypothetical protein
MILLVLTEEIPLVNGIECDDRIQDFRRKVKEILYEIIKLCRRRKERCLIIYKIIAIAIIIMSCIISSSLFQAAV